MGRYIRSINADNQDNFMDFMIGYMNNTEIPDELKKISPDNISIGTTGNDTLAGGDHAEKLAKMND